MLHLQRFDWDWDANSRIKVGPQSPSPAPFHPRRAPLRSHQTHARTRRAPLRSHQTHARTRPSPQVCDRLAFPPALPAALLAELLASGRPAGRGAAPPADPAPYDLQAVLVRSSRGGPDVSPEAGPMFLPRRARRFSRGERRNPPRCMWARRRPGTTSPTSGTAARGRSSTTTWSGPAALTARSLMTPHEAATKRHGALNRLPGCLRARARRGPRATLRDAS
jgi:hypothetical protein